jgi:hypothetical protein
MLRHTPRNSVRWLSVPGLLALAAMLAACPDPPVSTNDAGFIGNDPVLVFDAGPLVPEGDGGAAGDGGEAEADAGPAVGQVFIESVTPPTGVLTGGYRVRLQGFGFTPPPESGGDQRVFFGEHEADQILYLNDRSVTVRVPAGDVAGPVAVRMENGLGSYTADSVFTYFSPVELDAVDPATGSTTGGTAVTLTGEGLHDELIVLVGGRQAVDLVVNAEGTSATFMTPPGVPGRADIEAIDNFGRSVLPLAFTYVADLALEQVVPQAALVGDIVELKGAGFDESTVARLGGETATADNLISEGRLRVVVPGALVPGLVDAEVERDGTVATLAGALWVLDPAAVGLNLEAVVPASADSTGGETVVLVGTGLSTTTDVTVGGTAATSFEVLDDNRLSIEVPAGTAGAADVVVTTTDFGADTYVGFSYVDGLGLESVSPASGDAAGGTAVTLTGRGFVAGAVVTFGGVPATDVVVVSDTEITATAPAGSSGAVDVRVEQTGDSAVLEGAFRYDAALRVLGVRPSRGGISGNTYVTISGEGFEKGGAPSVSFGPLPASDVVVVSDSIITARTPFGEPGVTDVTVDLGGESSVAVDAYTYFDPTFIVGGSRGGPVDGAVYVTALDAFTALPIEGLVAFLGTEADTPYAAVTNIIGQATLSGPDVVGAQTVSVVGQGYEYASVVDVNASEITLYLQPLALGPPGNGQPPPPPPPATIRGRVFGFAKEFFDPAALGPDEIALAVVVTTARDEFSGTPPPGGDNVVFQEGGEYFIANSRPGRVALVALAGIFNLETGQFRMRQMGVRRNVYPELGVDLVDQDITLSISLDQDVALSLPDAPVGNGGVRGAPDITRVIPFLRFGGEGALAYTQAVDTTRNHMLETMPDVPGEMLTFVAGAFTTNDQGLVTDQGTLDLVEGEPFAFGSGTNWSDADLFTGQPLVAGGILVVNSPDGQTWATNVVTANSATEILLEEPAPFTTFGATYTIGSATYPSSQVVQDGVGDLIGGVTIQPVLGLPEPIAPMSNGVMENRTLRWKAAPGQLPTNHLMYVYDPVDFAVLWTFYVDGSRTKVPIPQIPAMAGDLDGIDVPPPDMGLGGYAWQHTAMYVPGFEFTNFSYIELGSRARRAWTTDLHFFVYPGATP